PAVTDGAHPGRGQGDRSEPARPKFADVGDAHSAHATDEDTSVQSAPANNGHHWGADPEINFASIAKTDLPQHPADNSLHMPAQLDDNGSPAVTDGAQPAHPHSDGNQLDAFKFADDSSAHPGTVPYGPPTVTALSSDLGGDHGPAAPALANTVNVPGT